MSTGVVMSVSATALGRPVTSETSISKQYSECQVRALRTLSLALIALSEARKCKPRAVAWRSA